MFVLIIILECVGLIMTEEEGNFVVVGGNRRAAVRTIGDYEYWMFKERKTWPEAVLQCEKEGTEIAEVRTIEEAKRLAQIMMRNRPDAIESAWIGGYGKNKTGGTTWRWISTNEEISRSILWRVSQKTITNPTVRGCLLFDCHLWEEPTFIESPCDRRREFICQKTSNDAIVPTKRPSTHQASLSTRQTTFSTVSVSTMTSVITSTEKLLPTENTKLSSISAELRNNDRNSTTALPMNLIDRKNIQADTGNYQEREEDDDYYNYDETSDPSTSTTITKSPTEITTTKTTSTVVYLPEREEDILYKNPVNFYSQPERRNYVKPLKPLKLYYEFEGPIIGALNVNANEPSDFHSGRRYQKYVAVKKKPFGSVRHQSRERFVSMSNEMEKLYL